MARGDTKPWVELFDFLSTEEITPAKTQSTVLSNGEAGRQ